MTADLRSLSLTDAEQAVASLLVLGLSSSEIADLLGIQTNAVYQRVYRLRRKLGMPNRSALVRYLTLCCSSS